ncbi:tetratricopeptide repeat protein [uncultured Desulfovibrio sp.]|uniref:tetratricopeptide repeat protein n=1 Tax=uncultured Desulfovibrio sp. TaxID=167968 RepID=UPI0003A0E714|nr:tetratricopeptide repeat protein [uncultured Desulfovibrio sp.]
MIDLPKLNGPAHALVLLLALALAAMLVISLTERFRNPYLTVIRDAPQAPAGMGDAVGMLMQEVAKDPKNVDVMVHLAEALMSAQNWEAAETFTQRAMTLDLDNPQPLYLLGVIKHNQGKHKEAAELLEKVVALHDNASARYSLGVLYIHFLHDPKRGVAHLSAGLHDPKASEDLKKGIREELEKAPLPHAGDAEIVQPEPRNQQPQASAPAKTEKKVKKTSEKGTRP